MNLAGTAYQIEGYLLDLNMMFSVYINFSYINMKEEFLHYAWKTRQFKSDDLQTTGELSLKIVHPGELNTDSGPDFFNAKIMIDGQLWVGNVEIHVRASDWIRHRHEQDAAYDNVVLHVVFENDAPVATNAGGIMPTLELKSRINQLQYVQYLRLRSSKESIPCASRLDELPGVIAAGWLSRLLVERLERKVALLEKELENSGNDWDEVFYRHLARQFGMKVNADPFQWLASAAPYKILARQSDNLLQTEALLFGQSGLLPEKVADVYTGALIREYAHMQVKYNVRPMPTQRWKFMRLRPNNFPTLRIAQLAGLLYRNSRLFVRCMETHDVVELRGMLDVPASGYWETHYVFGKSSRRRTKNLGPQAIDTILVNTIVPFKFLYGRTKGDEAMQAQAVELLETLPPEDNQVVREWQRLGLHACCAGETQAMLELSGNYCEKRRCLQCHIGNWLLDK
jgi:hypothetical protein